MSQGYVTIVALNYTFHFYRLHEHISISHETGSFNKHLRKYMFYVLQCRSRSVQVLRIKC